MGAPLPQLHSGPAHFPSPDALLCTRQTAWKYTFPLVTPCLKAYDEHFSDKAKDTLFSLPTWALCHLYPGNSGIPLLYDQEPFTLTWPQIMAHAFLQTLSGLPSWLLSLSPASSSKSHVMAPVPTEIFLLEMPTHPVKSTNNWTLDYTLGFIPRGLDSVASLASNTHFLKNDQLFSLIALFCPFLIVENHSWKPMNFPTTASLFQPFIAELLKQ